MTIKQFIKKYVAPQERDRAEEALEETITDRENVAYNEALRDVQQQLRLLAGARLYEMARRNMSILTGRS